MFKLRINNELTVPAIFALVKPEHDDLKVLRTVYNNGEVMLEYTLEEVRGR